MPENLPRVKLCFERRVSLTKESLTKASLTQCGFVLFIKQGGYPFQIGRARQIGNPYRAYVLRVLLLLALA
jgi:hypothetical protein